MEEKNVYVYNGAVKVFDKTVTDNWTGRTDAASPEKAKANLTYRFKKETKRAQNCKFTLTGTIVKEEEP